MKKLITLFTLLFLCTCTMFAQKKYVDLVENGHMEEAQSEDWSCFWCHEWRTNDEQTRYFANIVEDPLDPKNHCAKVFVRTEAEADEAGNKTLGSDNSSLASWDSQFFVYVREKIESGKMLKLTMRVRADKECSIETQAHYTPGDYNHYQMFGNINVTTQWQKIEVETTVNTSQTQEDNGKEMHSVAFNLATLKDGNNFYFDDVKLEIKDQVINDFTGWLNMLRNTDLTSETINDKVVNGYSYFTGRDAALNKDLPARIVIDPLDGKPAMNITSLEPCRQGTTETVDEETGEVTVEPNGTYYQWVERAILDENNQETGETEWKEEEILDWSTQFFVSQPHEFKMNEKVRFVMWARADKPAQIDSQIHKAPGSYIHWQFLGSFDLTEEWQRFEVETEISDNAQVGGWTVAFNSNKLREANNYYFRIEEFSINEADATDNDRTIGSGSITFPVSVGEDARIVKVDMSDVMKVLGIENLRAMLTSDNIMKVIDDEGVFMEQGFNPVYEGASLNTSGFYDENGTVCVEVDDGESTETEAAFIITNLGEELAEPFDSKLCFDKDGWYYVFNVKFVPAKDYDGIKEIDTKAQTGTIYDLSGRRVSTPVKGLYIQNGKKFVK